MGYDGWRYFPPLGYPYALMALCSRSLTGLRMQPFWGFTRGQVPQFSCFYVFEVYGYRVFFLIYEWKVTKKDVDCAYLCLRGRCLYGILDK